MANYCWTLQRETQNAFKENRINGGKDINQIKKKKLHSYINCVICLKLS
jgi:hypothetical protein